MRIPIQKLGAIAAVSAAFPILSGVTTAFSQEADAAKAALEQRVAALSEKMKDETKELEGEKLTHKEAAASYKEAAANTNALKKNRDARLQRGRAHYMRRATVLYSGAQRARNLWINREVKTGKISNREALARWNRLGDNGQAKVRGQLSDQWKRLDEKGRNAFRNVLRKEWDASSPQVRERYVRDNWGGDGPQAWNTLLAELQQAVQTETQRANAMNTAAGRVTEVSARLNTTIGQYNQALSKLNAMARNEDDRRDAMNLDGLAAAFEAARDANLIRNRQWTDVHDLMTAMVESEFERSGEIIRATDRYLAGADAGHAAAPAQVRQLLSRLVEKGNKFEHDILVRVIEFKADSTAKPYLERRLNRTFDGANLNLLISAKKGYAGMKHNDAGDDEGIALVTWEEFVNHAQGEKARWEGGDTSFAPTTQGIWNLI